MLSCPAVFPGLLCDYQHLLPPSGNAEAPPFPQGGFPLKSFPVKERIYNVLPIIYIYIYIDMWMKIMFPFLPLGGA